MDRVRVFRDLGGHWLAELDYEGGGFVCIGYGATREDAVASAEKELLGAIQELRKNDDEVDKSNE